jgi:hypothetical protein
VPLDQPAHHLGLATRTKSRAATLAGFDSDQPVNDVAALHETAMEIEIDAIDLLPESAEVGQFGFVYLVHCGALALPSIQAPQRSANRYPP